MEVPHHTKRIRSAIDSIWRLNRVESLVFYYWLTLHSLVQISCTCKSFGWTRVSGYVQYVCLHKRVCPKAFQPWIRTLTNLKELVIDDCRLKCITAVEFCYSLEKLVLRKVHVEKIPDLPSTLTALFVQNCQYLKDVSNLANSNIEVLSIRDCDKLRQQDFAKLKDSLPSLTTFSYRSLLPPEDIEWTWKEMCALCTSFSALQHVFFDGPEYVDFSTDFDVTNLKLLVIICENDPPVDSAFDPLVRVCDMDGTRVYAAPTLDFDNLDPPLLSLLRSYTADHTNECELFNYFPIKNLETIASPKTLTQLTVKDTDVKELLELQRLFPQMAQLSHLILETRDTVTTIPFASLPLPSLKKLELFGQSLKGDCLLRMSKTFPELKILHFRTGQPIGERHLAYILALRRLEKLYIGTKCDFYCDTFLGRYATQEVEGGELWLFNCFNWIYPTRLSE